MVGGDEEADRPSLDLSPDDDARDTFGRHRHLHMSHALGCQLQPVSETQNSRAAIVRSKRRVPVSEAAMTCGPRGSTPRPRPNFRHLNLWRAKHMAPRVLTERDSGGGETGGAACRRTIGAAVVRGRWPAARSGHRRACRATPMCGRPRQRTANRPLHVASGMGANMGGESQGTK